MFSLILVDDQPIFRDIMQGVLQRTGRFQFLGEAEDGEEAVALYARVRPDAVIMDVQMPKLNGFEATVRILEDNPDAVVILTSMQEDGGFASAAQQAGAIGFLPKRHFDAESVIDLLENEGGAAGQGFMAA